MKTKATRFGLVGVSLLLLGLAEPARAQSGNVVGATVDISGGGNTNSTAHAVTPASNEFGAFYGLYPSLTFTSGRASSNLTLGYAFGLNGGKTTTGTGSQSHSFNGNFSSRLAPDWTVGISESFQATEDSQTFYALRGVAAPDEGPFVFAPVALRIQSRGNNLGLSVGHPLSESSGLSISGGHALRTYGSGAAETGKLPDQQQFSWNVGYNHRLSTRESWNLEYAGSYQDFVGFSDSTSNAVNVGYSILVAKDTTLQFGTGFSRTLSVESGDAYIGYNSTASLQKTIGMNGLTVSFNQNSGTATGLGTTSRTQQFSLGWTRRLGRAVNAFANATAFNSVGTLDNTFSSNGAFATANIGYTLSKDLSLQGGFQYQRSGGDQTFAFTQKRVFFSLRYAVPQLWHFR